VRTFAYHRPEGIREGSPLIIALHKARSNGEEFREMLKFRLDYLADEKQFIAVYPDGFEGNWNDCRKGAGDSAHRQNVDDVGFVSALIDYFAEKHGIDRNRVFVMGMSNGGQMCFRLACEIPQKISAMAPLLAQYPVTENSVCTGKPGAMPVFLLNGTDDPVSPFAGGEVSVFGIIRWGMVLSAGDTAELFRTANGADSLPRSESIKPEGKDNNMWVEKRVWPGQNTLRQDIVHGGGHTLPGTRPLSRIIYGATYGGISTADEVVRFFFEVKGTSSGRGGGNRI